MTRFEAATEAIRAEAAAACTSGAGATAEPEQALAIAAHAVNDRMIGKRFMAGRFSTTRTFPARRRVSERFTRRVRTTVLFVPALHQDSQLSDDFVALDVQGCEIATLI